MAKTTPMPSWLRRLYKELTFTVQIEGKARLRARYTPRGAADRKTGLLEIFLVPTGAAKTRAKDRNGVKTFISYISIAHAESAFHCLEQAIFSYDGDGHPVIEYEGTVDDHEIVVALNITPLDEADVAK